MRPPRSLPAIPIASPGSVRQTDRRSRTHAHLAALLLVLLCPLPARAESPLLGAARQAWRSGRQVRALSRLVAARVEGSTPKLDAAREQHRLARRELRRAVAASPAVQLLRGIGRGPAETWQTIRQHPVKMVGAALALAAVSAALEVLSLPAQPLMLGACGLLTLKAMKHGYPETRSAFRRRAPDRFQVLGQRLLFPALAYGGATALTFGVGGVVERLSGSHLLAEGSKGVAYGIHILDDLPAIATSLGGSQGRQKR